MEDFGQKEYYFMKLRHYRGNYLLR